VLVAVLARMIITPLLLLPVIAVLAKYDLFEAAEDPVFILAAVLLVSSVSYAFRVSANATGLLDATQELMSSHLH
jgi:hypothetical protein